MKYKLIKAWLGRAAPTMKFYEASLWVADSGDRICIKRYGKAELMLTEGKGQYVVHIKNADFEFQKIVDAKERNGYKTHGTSIHRNSGNYVTASNISDYSLLAIFDNKDVLRDALEEISGRAIAAPAPAPKKKNVDKPFAEIEGWGTW